MLIFVPLYCCREESALAYKDAVFFSMHKFVGGPDSPGVLVAKKQLFSNPVPSHSGGGTVFFVTPTKHRYFRPLEVREEGGTPSIIGSIRAGLAMQVKEVCIVFTGKTSGQGKQLHWAQNNDMKSAVAKKTMILWNS